MTKAETSRRNRAQSKGPSTPEGKIRAAGNAITHGLNSKVVVLKNESQEEYDDLLWDYMRHYDPAGPIELDLVHEIAANRWRLRRCLRLESAAFDQAMENDPESVLHATFGQNGVLRHLSRYEGRLRRAYERAVAELRRIQAERKAAAEQRAQKQKEQIEPRSYLQIYKEAVERTPQLPTTNRDKASGEEASYNKIEVCE